MKKMIIMFVFALISMGSCLAATICAKNNTFVGVLKKSVAGLNTGYAYDNTNKEWKVDFGYKVITGVAACNEISGTTGVAQTNLYTSAVDAGEDCWCKMEPVTNYGYETGITSYWVFFNQYADAATCASSCTEACMNAMKSNTTFRSAVFDAVW